MNTVNRLRNMIGSDYMYELKWYVFETGNNMNRVFDSYADMMRFLYTIIWSAYTIEYTAYENGIAIHSGNTVENNKY